MDPRNYGPGGYDPANYGAAGGPGLGGYAPGYGPMLPGPGGYGPGYGPMLPGPGAGHVGHGPKDYTKPDARILEDVCEKLALDPVIDARGVSVRVEDGIVHTSGMVESRQMKRMVEDIALTVWGVKDVNNQIGIAPAYQE